MKQEEAVRAREGKGEKLRNIRPSEVSEGFDGIGA